MKRRSRDRRAERRRHERLELCASVLIKGNEEIPLLSVRDISLSGAFLASGGTDLSMFAIGAEHRVVVLDVRDPAATAEVTATIVRHEYSGMAIDWSGSPGAALKIATLLEDIRRREERKATKHES
jgi:hypothetical protein